MAFVHGKKNFNTVQKVSVFFFSPSTDKKTKITKITTKTKKTKIFFYTK